jgi:DNA polymerase-1
MNAQDKRLFLLDGMALIYRAYFAFSKNPRITSKGMNTSAMFGFTNTLLDLLNREKPTHIAVVFDTPAPTERHEMFPEYKAQRESMPEDLSKSIPYIFRIIEAFRIPVITMDGFEADDIIGTLAKKGEPLGYITYMVTPDKDYGQLVSDKIFMYKPGRQGNDFEIMGVPEVLQKWAVKRIDQVIDMLGLMGDASDNIPGIKGVGEKTAQKLLEEFDSMENILQNTDKLKGALREKIEQHADLGRLSKKLATIVLDVPIEFDETAFTVDPIDKDKIKEVFTELEFRTLLDRVLKNNTSSAPVQQSLFGSADGTAAVAQTFTVEKTTFETIETMPHKYTLIRTIPAIERMVAELIQQKDVCFDTETTGIDALNAELVGCSFSFKKGTGYYIPMPENREECMKYLEPLKEFFENEKVGKTGQNIKYDLMVLNNYGIEIKGSLFDTMLAHYLIEPEQRHGMDVLAERYLGYAPVSISTLIGKKGKGQLNMRDVDIEKVAEYATEDADITWQLREKLEPELDKIEVRSVFNDIEIPLIEVLASMETDGINLDKDFLKVYSRELQMLGLDLEQKIYAGAGQKFNIASPKQLGELMFDKLKLDPKAKKTKTGQYQTGEDILTKLANHHPLPSLILDYREIQKLKSTYVDALPSLVNTRTGRVHTSFNQAVAATGRLSSNNPNLQNIPIRTAKGREIRKAFIPRDEYHVLVSADYSQIELRIIASVSHDEGMIDAFKKGLDIHTATASRVFGVPLAQVDSEMRRRAKSVNFGIIYGISAFGLSNNIGISRDEAKTIIDNYFREFSGIKRYMEQTIHFCREHGFVKTIMGRRRYIRDITSQNQTVVGFAERNAINAPIQGSAADMIKLAMINIFKRLNKDGFKSRMILQVHDELVFDVPLDEVSNLKEMVKEEMERAMPLGVPVLVEAGSGKNWLEAH